MKPLIFPLALTALVAAAGALAAVPPEELFRGVFVGDVGVVRGALDAGADVNARHAGATALHVAAEHGRTEMARLLLARGADVDAPDDAGDSPLNWAAAGGHVELAALLIGRGADVNRRRPTSQPNSDDSWGALRWAIDGEHPAMVRLLIDSGARLTDPDDLISAVQSGDRNLLAAVLDAGSKVLARAQTRWGSSREALNTAARAGSLEILRLLISRAGARKAVVARLTAPLQHAAENGHLEIVRFLLEEMKVSPDAQLDDSFGGVTRVDEPEQAKPEGFTALSRAVEQGHEEVVALLLAKGARIAGRMRGGEPLVSFAVAHGRTDLLRLFLQREAATEGGDFDGKSALMHAAEMGKIEEAKLLLAHQASVKKRDRGGATALLLAAGAGRGPLIELLLRHGASISEKSSDGRTALMHAAGSGHADTCRLLARHGAKVDEQQAETKQTALHWAARGAHPEAVRALLELGATRAGRDATGRTARDYADLLGDVESCDLLDSKPADTAK